MPDEFTKEEKEILSEAPADSPTRATGDEENLPSSQSRQPAEGGREEAEG
jgi:hypothetical protein